MKTYLVNIILQEMVDAFLAHNDETRHIDTAYMYTGKLFFFYSKLFCNYHVYLSVIKSFGRWFRHVKIINI